MQKQHQPTGLLTRGVAQDPLTKSPTHPHGIEVHLETGVVDRVKEILSEEQAKRQIRRHSATKSND